MCVKVCVCVSAYICGNEYEYIGGSMYECESVELCMVVYLCVYVCVHACACSLCSTPLKDEGQKNAKKNDLPVISLNAGASFQDNFVGLFLFVWVPYLVVIMACSWLYSGVTLSWPKNARN